MRIMQFIDKNDKVHIHLFNKYGFQLNDIEKQKILN